MLEQVIIHYGYLVLFAGTMVEGDAFLLAASFLAHRGYLHLPRVLAVATAATMAADQVYYQLARARGQAAFAARAAADARFDRVRRWIERRGELLLFLSRFMYGFRIAIPVACGAVGMPALRFALINLFGSFVWALCFGLAGYAFGNAVEILLDDVKRYEALAVVVLLGVVAVGAALRTRDLKQRLAALRHPAQEAVRLARDVFAGAGRIVLARPHARIAAFVVAVGLLNVATAVFHWRFMAIDVLDAWLPLEVRHASRAALLLSGVALVAVGRGLNRHKRVAWAIASLAALASVPLHVGQHGGVVRAALSSWLLWELARHAHRFTAKSDPARQRTALIALPVLAVVLSVYGMAGYDRMQVTDARTAAAMTWDAIMLQPDAVPGHRGSLAFGWSISALAAVSATYVLVALLAPVAYRRESATDSRRIASLAWEHGTDSLSYFAKQDDKSHALFGDDVFVAYRVVRRVAVVVGDPVGPPGRVPAAIAAFVAACRENDWVPVFYETSDRWLPAYEASGLKCFKVGEEAVIPLAGFTLAGSKIKNLRNGIAKVERDAPGIAVREYPPTERDAEIDEQLEDISSEWLQGKGIGEMGFNLGVFSVSDLADKRTMIASTPDGSIWAFLTWLPYRGGQALVLDAMRRRSNAPASVIDLLIAKSALLFKEEGIEAVSLATAPLANVDAAAVSAYDKGVRLIFEHFSTVYGYRSLFQFKKKFNPAWEGRYLVFPRADLLPRIAYALTAVHIEGGVAAAARQFVSSKVAEWRRRSQARAAASAPESQGETA
jgi:phosphatidylglycerol lysyltransferase